MKYFLTFIFISFYVNPLISQCDNPKRIRTKEDKTFVGKGLAEIDNVATKAWQELMKLFKKRPFAYKPAYSYLGNEKSNPLNRRIEIRIN